MSPEPERDAPATIVATLLVSDLVDSTRLVERLGDAAAADLLARHDRVARDLLAAHGGVEVDHTDGFLVRFARPVDAVGYALAYHAALAALDTDRAALVARVGVHLGEVVVRENAPDDIERGAKPVEVEGIAKPTTARLAALAQGRQTLMTRAAFDLARRGGVGHGGLPAHLTWHAHGPYLFKGVEDPVEVFEVGVPGCAPLTPPTDTEKARRAVTPGDESTLGWRPAAGLEVPGRTGWRLERKLGDGGFGEVWLAEHTAARTARVFKFCFDADRLRSLKRELTLFRLLQQSLGARDDIATLFEVRLDEPPYFLETEYTSGGSLVDWAAARGGLREIPLSTRLDIVARVARAIAAAHSVGVLHKDVKPANVLIDDRDDVPCPRLADFGIGGLAPDADVGHMTMAGFTQSLPQDEASHTGTLLYVPPESAAGHGFTVAGDVYALGVMLYQAVVGDLGRPLASGWERDVADPLLRRDIAACVDADADRRPSARDLAERLDRLPERRRRWRRRRLARAGAIAGALAVVLLGIATAWGLREMALRASAEDRRDEANESLNYVLDMLGAADPWDRAGTDVRVVDVLDRAAAELEDAYPDRPRLRGRLHLALGHTYRNLSRFDAAEAQLATALELLEQSGDEPDIATAHHEYGATLFRLGHFDDARGHYEAALAARRRIADADRSDDAAALALAETATHMAAVVTRTGGTLADAETFAREALAVRRAHLPYDHREIGRALNNLAFLLLEQGRPAEAEAIFHEALALFRRLHGDAPHVEVAGCMGNLARCVATLGRLQEARTLLEQALAMKREVLIAPDASLASTLHELGRVEIDLGDGASARGHLEEALRQRRAVLPAEHPGIAATEALLRAAGG